MPETLADPAEILAFWFDESTPQQWFRKDPDFDAAIRDRFADTHRAAAAGALDGWAETAEGLMALVLVLDQFSRNLHRGSADAFAQDAKALALARDGIARGLDLAIAPPDRRVFLYLPFEHSEDPADQEEAIRLCEARTEDPVYVDFARRHRDVIAEFGRFPHRNAVLGRLNTPAEEAYLARPDAGF